MESLSYGDTNKAYKDQKNLNNSCLVNIDGFPGALLFSVETQQTIGCIF